MKVLKGKSGITVLFRPMKTGLVDFRYSVQVGGVDESPEEWGYCHALEHMVFAGTKKRTWLQINREWEKHGTYYNAHTYHDRTTYEFSGLKRSWKEDYEVLADMFYNCQFPSERWEDVEKPAVISEIESDLDDEGEILDDTLYNKGIGSRYHSVVGGLNEIRSATIDDLTKFYKEHYCGSNVFLLVTGDLSETELMRVVNKYDRLRDAKPPKRQKFEFKFNYAPVTLKHPGVQQAYLQSLKPLAVPRTLQSRTALGIGISCLGQYLFEELREKRGLVYGAGSSLYWNIPGHVFLSARTATEMARLTKTQRALKKAINNFSQEGLTVERIQNMKMAELYSTVSDSEDIDTSAGWLWDAWEENFTKGDIYKEYIKLVDGLSVESIRNTTRRALSGKMKTGKLIGS